ncbi:MAG: AAA family ATPase, partial [Oscillospiraceae bacterium]|nr:AAA family ATPase [Oscillospiraceae bacterium]
VALVAAFASEADLFILDEPTSGLDPLMMELFVEQVLELKRGGKGIFLSSHILSEVERLCDRVGIIMKGRLLKTGTLEELKQSAAAEDGKLPATMEELFMRYYKVSEAV